MPSIQGDAPYPTKFPEVGDQEGLLGYRERFFNKEANYRLQHLERISLNHYYRLGQQWGDSYGVVGHETSGGYGLSYYTQSSEHEVPKPVLNLVSLAVKAETSAIGKRRLVFKVVPTSTDPKIETAAKVATDILTDRQRKLHWPAVRRKAIGHFVVGGFTVLRSGWDEVWTESTTIGSPDALQCPQCPENLLASPEVPAGQFEQAIPSAGGLDTDLLEVCPDCGAEMQPYEVAPNELESTDMLGRSMGVDVPRGKPTMEVIPFNELFLENSGVDLEPSEIKVWGRKKARSLDWYDDHYPGVEIIPNGSQEIMREHPLLGDRRLVTSYTPTLDSNIYENYAFCYEIIHEKSRRFPQGRYVVMTDTKVLEDTPLYRTVGGVEVSRVHYGSAHWEERIGEFYSKSHVDDLRSPNNVINGQFSQIIEAGNRMGSPNIIIPDSVYIGGPEWHEDWGSGRILRYEISPIYPQAKPEILEGTGASGSVFRTLDTALALFEKLGGPPPIQRGEAPKNITTTSGLQLLNEGSDLLRQEQEDALIALFEDMWGHQLQLLAAFRTEGDEDTYQVTTDAGSMETRSFDASTLAGQTNVKVEKQSYVDKSVYMKEAAREAQLDQLYDLSKPSAKVRMLELRGLPTDVNDGDYKQVKSARRQWINFRDQGLIPIIDETLDDPGIHYEELGTFLQSDDGIKLAEDAGWPEIQRKLGGWKYKFNKMYMEDQAAREFYGGVPLNPEQAYNEAMMGWQQQVADIQAQFQASQQLAIQDEQTKIPQEMLQPALPPPPPVPNFLPPALQDKILAVWQQLLTEQAPVDPTTGQPGPTLPPAAGMEQDPNAAAQAQQNFLQFRAVYEGYKIMLDERIQAQMMGLALAPSPSSQGEFVGDPLQPGQAGSSVSAPLSQYSSPPTPPQVTQSRR